MNGTIICAVDDSDTAESAVEAAARVAERFDSRMLLVRVTDADAPTRRTNEHASQLAQLEYLAVRHGVPYFGEHRVEFGAPVARLAELAAEEAALLIVVGAKGGIRRRSLRSDLARDLAETAPCPVLVAPPRSGSQLG